MVTFYVYIYIYSINWNYLHDLNYENWENSLLIILKNQNGIFSINFSIKQYMLLFQSHFHICLNIQVKLRNSYEVYRTYAYL